MNQEYYTLLFFPLFLLGKQAVIGYENGGVQILDLKKGHASNTLANGQNHEAEVTCVSVHSDNRVILTGSSDATAKIINSSNMHVKKSYSFPYV